MSASGDRDQEQLLSFVGELYDAAGDPSLWQPLAPKLANLVDAESCLLQIADTHAGGVQFLGATRNFSGSFWADYRNHYYSHDVWLTGGLTHLGHAILGQEVAPDDWYKNSGFINELCVSANIHSLVGASFSLGESKIGAVGIHRPKDRPFFDEADRKKIDGLVSHIARAMQLSRRFAEAGLDHQASHDRD